jgi:hypothetical protein
MEEYEQLDLICCQATTFAESKCRKLRTGPVTFSPELAAVRQKIHAWQLLAKKNKGHKVGSRYLSRVLKKAQVSADARQLSEEAIQNHLKAYLKKSDLRFKTIKAKCWPRFISKRQWTYFPSQDVHSYCSSETGKIQMEPAHQGS